MVYKYHRWAGAQWCTKTTIWRVYYGVQKLPLGRCTKTTVWQVSGGVRKPPLGGCAMVYKHYRWAGAQWCTKTTVGGCTMVYENRRWAGKRWRTKTAIGRVRDGVQKLPLGRCAMVHKNRRWAGEQWGWKTAARWVSYSVGKPSRKVSDENHGRADGEWCWRTRTR